MVLGLDIEARLATGASTASHHGIGYSGVVGANVSIDIDQHTAAVLEVRAAEFGLTVPQLIAELEALDGTPRRRRRDRRTQPCG